MLWVKSHWKQPDSIFPMPGCDSTGIGVDNTLIKDNEHGKVNSSITSLFLPNLIV